jgi:S1-C subfamily serine protease
VGKFMSHRNCAVLVLLAFAVPAHSQTKVVAKPKTSATATLENDYSKAIEKIRPSIVQVLVQSPEGTSQGTGFVVDSNHIITNCHVVGLCRVPTLFTNPQIVVAFRIPNFKNSRIQISESFRGFSAEIVGTDVDNDLTLLFVPGNIPFALQRTVVMGPGMEQVPTLFGKASLSAEMPGDGSEVLISGFPFKQPSLVTQRGMVASWIEREDVPLLDPWPEHSDIILIDGIVNHGNSGGPVYLANSAEVVGVAEAFFPATSDIYTNEAQPKKVAAVTLSNSGLSVVIPAKYVIALLDKYKVSATGAAGQPKIAPAR